MVHRIILLVSCGFLAACGDRAFQATPLLSISEGRYRAVIDESCMILAFNRRGNVSFGLDSNCDGQLEQRSDAVVEEDVIRTDAGNMTVTAVGGSSFSGIWRLGETAADIRFERVAGR